MPYNDVPLPTDLISDSGPEIRENFSLLESAQVVDEGTTADGDYIRYENGWQICVANIQLNYSTPEVLQNDWNYPVNFIEDVSPHGAASVVSGMSTAIPISYLGGHQESSNTTGALRAYSTNAQFVLGDTFTGRFFAIGRWK